MTTWERYGGSGRRRAPATWEDDPVAALAREAEGARWRNREKRERLNVELLAIIQLVGEHREEFDEIIARLEWRAENVERRDAQKRVERARKK
jgi:hypothetical protein